MYQIVGIGNALVDNEFLVSDEVLAKTGLSVGSMTLASQSEQEQLYEVLQAQGVTPKKQASGGSGANSIAAFASLGGRAYYHCRVGQDVLGRLYLDDLANSGVTTNADFACAEGITGSCAVLVSGNGERTMQTFLGTSSDINESNVDFETLVGADWLYLEGYLAMSPSIMSAITKLRQQAGVHGVKIAVSFADPSVIKFAKEGLLTMLGNGVSAIFCNLEEAQLLTDKKQHKACVKALTDYAKLVVVTNSGEPTVVAQKEGDEIEIFEFAVPTVTPLDTNGAGDNYAGAFLYGLSQQYSLEECAKLASAVSAQVVSQFGARLSTEAYVAIKKQVLG